MSRGASRKTNAAPTEGRFIVGVLGSIIDVDEGACALLGYSKAELLGLHGSELVPPERRPATAVSLDRMRRGDLRFSTGHLKCKDGTVLSVEVEARQLRSDQIALTVRKR